MIIMYRDVQRAEPHIPVKILWNRFFRKIVRFRWSADIGIDFCYLSECPGLYQLNGVLELSAGTLLAADGKNPVIIPNCLYQLLPFLYRKSERFLKVDIFTCL